MVIERKRENWIEGDTFAWEIKCKEYPKYNGRYFIFHYTIVPWWTPSEYQKTFRVRITKDDKLPTTKEEINKLEYVKTKMYDIRKEAYKNPEYIKGLIPDNNGYVTQYVMEISHEKDKPVHRQFKYIGNFSDIELPINEYIAPNAFCGIRGAVFKFLTRTLLTCYSSFNLKQSWQFEPKSVEQRNKEFNEWVKEQEEFEAFKKKLDGPRGKEILNAMGIDVENEKQTDSLTYVGPTDGKFKDK